MQSIHEMTLITFLVLFIVLLLHRHGPVKSAQLENDSTAQLFTTTSYQIKNGIVELLMQ